MKHITEREGKAIRKAIAEDLAEEWTTSEIDGLRDKIIQAIDNAEGQPEGSGDIYLDMKGVIINAVTTLNKEVQRASDLGLSVVIETLPVAPQTPAVPTPTMPGQAWGYNDLPSKPVMSKPQFKLSRLFKEF